MNVILLSGSNRKDAATTLLARAVGRRIEAAGHKASLFDLFEHPLPFFDPERDFIHDSAVNKLITSFLTAHAIVLASPEYHGTMSGLLKNALDFLALEHFDGKPVLALASAGGSAAFGTLTHIQEVVRNLHGINCPEWISIEGGERSFFPDGSPMEAKVRSKVESATDYFLRMARQLRPET